MCGELSEDTESRSMKKGRETQAQQTQTGWCTWTRNHLSPHSAHFIKGPCRMLGTQVNKTSIPVPALTELAPRGRPAIRSGREGMVHPIPDTPQSGQAARDRPQCPPLCTECREWLHQRRSGPSKGPRAVLPLKQSYGASSFPFSVSSPAQPSPALLSSPL